MKALKISMIAGLSAIALSACSGNAEAPAEDVVVTDETAAAEPMAADATAPKTIVALAQGNADLSTLVAAVTAADPRPRLRNARARDLTEFAQGAEEFVVLVARRNADGGVDLVGAVQDAALTDKVLAKTLV